MRYIVLFLICSIAYGADYYVDGDNGNDLNGGTNNTTDEWATIDHAVDTAPNGSVIYVQNNGTTVYAEAVSISDKTLTITGYGTSVGDNVRVIIDPSGLGAHGLSWANVNYRSLSLNNIQIQNSDQDGLYCDGLDFWRQGIVKVINCYFLNNTLHGTYTQRLWIFNFYRCVAFNNGSSGFHSLTSDSNTTQAAIFHSCIAYNNGGNGFNGAGLRDLAYTCLSVHNGANGFYRLCTMGCIADANTGDGFSSIVSGAATCIATRNGGYGFTPWWEAFTENIFVGSGVWANTSGGSSIPTQLGDQGIIAGEPQFIAPYSMGVLENWEDFNYGTQPGSSAQGLSQRIGLYEYGSTYSYADAGIQHVDNTIMIVIED